MSDSGDLSSAGTALSSAGSSSVGSNSYGFSLPSGTDTGSSPLAGLSGIQSGMTLPGQSAGANSFGFAMPGGLPGLASLAGPLGAASKQLTPPQSGGLQGGRGGGGITLRAQNFVAPISDQSGPAGSQAGSSLIELLQKYQPGRTQ